MNELCWGRQFSLGRCKWPWYSILIQFEELKSDFRYNLGLLEDRDAELLKYDTEHALLAATLTDRDRQLAEAQKLHADAASGKGG